MSTYEANRYNFNGANLNIPTSAITSGTFADARLAASNVTQHVDVSASGLTTTGVWTPGVSSGGLTSVAGHYQKVGRFVFCQFEARMNSAPAMGAEEDTIWYMTGLPFTAASYSSGYNGTWFPSSGSLSSASGFGIGGGFQVGVLDNTTNFYLHGNQGWRNTQYYLQHGSGGVRNRDIKLQIYDQGTNESWMYGRIFYVSAN